MYAPGTRLDCSHALSVIWHQTQTVDLISMALAEHLWEEVLCEQEELTQAFLRNCNTAHSSNTCTTGGAKVTRTNT